MKRYIYELIESANDLFNGMFITERADSREQADAIVYAYADQLGGKLRFVKEI